ncbi:MAG: hypothetical protein A3J79_05435 [Elusimicrobia bacterium RIFOXYB2_FULL_62_6]|nr:MAG: hypothetical protein A3J79_05435 [Elusimicrobia bacterium RIFOXYB2_FULL_62_6]
MKFLTLPLIALLSAPAFAGQALEDLARSAGTRAENVPAAAPAAVKAEPAPALLIWNQRVPPESYKFSWGEKTYSLDVLFGRGSYDPYVKAYKAKLQVMVYNWEGSPGLCGPLNAQEGYDFLVFDGPRDHVNVFLNEGNLVVMGVDDKSNYEQLAAVPVRSLLETWQRWAKENEPVKVGGRTFYMSQQASYQKIGEDYLWTYGYVLSENLPAQIATGLPQDYVELFRQNTAGFLDFRPKAYSMALGLVFEYKYTGEVPAWNVRQMRDSDMQAAMNDALGNRSGAAAAGPAALRDLE